MRDLSAFSHSEQVELATTDEMLDMFSTYVEIDVADARNRGSRTIKENIDIDHVGTFDVTQFEHKFVHTG